MRRVVVVGCSGAGKSTLAKRIADVLGAPHIELDALHWGPDWTPASAEELSAKVRQATTGAAWVVDGNYQGKIGSLAWELADAVVWVDPPRPTVMWRSISRTTRRVVTRAELWSGNREHWRGCSSGVAKRRSSGGPGHRTRAIASDTRLPCAIRATAA